MKPPTRSRQPLKIEIPFDEAVTRLLNVKPPAKPPKKKSAKMALPVTEL